MEYVPENVTDKIVDFVKSCPFLDEYGLETDIKIQSIDSVSDGGTLNYSGSKLLSRKSDMDGNGYTIRQANFEVLFVRKNSNNIQREDMANFMWNFEHWIEHCQFYNKIPKFSNYREEKVDEHMYASNGTFLGNMEKGTVGLYSVQIHIVYGRRYKDIIENF